MRNIAMKIAVYVGLIILLVCVGLGLFAYNSGSSAVLAEVEQALILQAEDASRYIETMIDMHLSVLETIAARPEISSMEWEAQKSIIQLEGERLSQFLALGVVDPNGLARYSDGSTANLGDREYVIQGLNGNAVVSDLIVSRVNNSLVLMYAVPIKRNGQVVGVLIARRDGTALSDITDHLGFGENGWAQIFHQDGTVYADPEREDVLNGRNIFTDTGNLAGMGKAIQELGIGQTGVISYNVDNVTILSGIATSPSTGWMVAIGVMESDVLRNMNTFRNLLVWVALLFIVVGVALAIFLGKQIANPLLNVQEVIEAVAEGDLTKTVEIKARDEVGRVGDALNTTIENIRNAMHSVSDATEELVSTGEEMAAASQEVSASIEEVASTTNQFSSALDMMSQNAQNMSANVQEISNNAAQGGLAIEGTSKQMQALRDSTEKLANDVSGLGTLSNEIGYIVNVIGDIASQTNLLALNAAIEAARAGEHGRGFAVVADEVRGLAEQSAKATTEITSLINQIQEGISSSVTGMNEGAAQTVEALDSVDESGKILGEILREVEDIVASVQEISAGLEQTNSGGHEIASATEEQAASIQHVASAAQDLTAMGGKLQELVQHFRLQ